MAAIALGQADAGGAVGADVDGAGAGGPQPLPESLDVAAQTGEQVGDSGCLGRAEASPQRAVEMLGGKGRAQLDMADSQVPAVCTGGLALA